MLLLMIPMFHTPLAQKQPVKKKPQPAIKVANTLHRNANGYMDTIYLGSIQTAFVDVKGFTIISGGIGNGHNSILKLAIPEKSHIVKLQAIGVFPETHLFLIGEDTVIQFLVRYRPNPTKNYYRYFLPVRQTSLAKLTDSLSSATIENRKANTMRALIPPAGDTGLYNTEFSSHTIKKSKTITDYSEDYTILKNQEKNLVRTDVNKSRRIELNRMYVIGKRMYLGMMMHNEWKGSMQLSDIILEMIHSVKGSKTVIDPDIEATAYNNVNAFSKQEFAIGFPFIQSEYGDKLIITLKPVKENNLPDYVINIMNRDFNLIKYINKRGKDGKNK